MKTKSIILCFATVVFLSGSLWAQKKKEVAEKLFSDMVGTWRVQTIYDGKKDITSKGSTKVQWLEFAEDGHYKSVTGTLATDSGSYRVNESHKSLYLQSVVDTKGTDNTVEWKADFKDNTLTLTQSGTPHAARYRYVYVKTKDKASANRPIVPQQ